MTWDDAEANFAERFSGYESRPPQRNLALTIEGALAAGAHLAAQAACGTGKSYAGLVPAIDYAQRVRRPVVVATATKALQDQYASKDLPALQQLYKPFRFAVLKGRSNYLCLAKLEESPALNVDTEALRTELKDPETTGDFDQLQIGLSDLDKYKLSTSSEECPGKSDCPFGEVCFAERAKLRARESDVVITNHALLVTDALLGGGALLPEYSGVLIDEAHELEDYTTSTLGSEVTERQITRLATDVAAFLEDRSHLASAARPVAQLFGTLAAKLPERESVLPINATTLLEIGEDLGAVLEVLNGYDSLVRLVRTHGNDELIGKRKRLMKRLDNMITKLTGIIMSDFVDLVRWIERETVRPKNGEPYTQIILKFAPLTVGEFLQKSIWSRVPAVLMSATLAVGTDFDFLTQRLGFAPAEIRTFDAGTPFDFTTQARTYVPDIPNPKRNPGGYRAGVTTSIIELVKAADGRALLLFTSWVSLNETYQALAPIITAMGHRSLRQGELPNPQLAKIFAEDEHSVLFAVKSFFTGVDIQGDSLRLVVIDKLPFTVPTDVIFKARCDLIDATNGGKPWGPRGSFERLSIPSMALTLLQGYGRLIRSQTDQGVVAILDPRLLTERYGKTILGTFPDAPLITRLDEATGYLHSLEEKAI